MPFLAPIIGAAIGGLATTLIGQAVIGAALSLAMGAIARRLTPKPEGQSFARGAHLRLAADAQMPRVVIMGEAAVAGSLVYHHVYDQTRKLELVLALADHECEALTGIWVAGKPVTWDSGTGLVTEYPGMRIRFFSGAWTQSADADLVANSGGRWTTSDRGRGICYVYVHMIYNAELYKGRQPEMLFKVRGAKLYDWRKDATAGGAGSHRWGTPSTYEWSDNPAVAWYNYRRGFFVNGVQVAGMTTAPDALPLDAATAAANACDEIVSLKAGGSEKRYRISAAIVTGQKHREIVRDIVAACGGEEIDTGGALMLAPGIAQAPVMALSDDDMMADADVEWSGAHGRRDIVNAVFGSFRDPVQRYEAVSLPPRQSSADETADGGRYEQRYDLDMVASGTQGQRILEILRRRARREGTAKGTFRAKACVLEPGDWITFSSARFGFDAKPFEVVSASIARDLSTELVLRETDVDVYDWTPASDELDSLSVPDLPAGGGGLTSLSGLAVETIEVAAGAGSATRPGLRLTWTAVTDPSVVEIEIETRKQGDAAFSGSRKAFNPSVGQHAWVDGILGDTDYEVRARPVTVPARAVSWSAWIAPATATEPQVVDVGTLVAEPGTITPEMLDAQTRFELRLATALAAVQGSAAEDAADALAWAEAVADRDLAGLLTGRETQASVRQEVLTRQTEALSLATRIDTVAAALGTAQARIETETTARVTGDSALASEITTVATSLNGNIAAVVALAESVDGLEARWGVAININGQVVGLVRLDGSASGSQFTVLADKFLVARPDGTGPIPVFVVGSVNGVSQVAINGGLLVDGSILARHLSVTSLSSIVANIGDITAGIMRSADNKFRIDLNAKTIAIET
jgi:hypothetical protein